MMRYWSLVLAVLSASLFCPPPGASADQALAVGINSYPNLPASAQLEGADNDATAMARKLQDLGFTVTELKDAEATKSGVLAALERMESSAKPNDRVVVYFAGHGATAPDGEGVILTSDADPADQTNYLSSSELYSAVCAIPAVARTILLDSCFSGALSRGLSPISIYRKPRFYNFFGVDKKGFDLANMSSDEAPLPSAKGDSHVCYFAAAAGAEMAYEDEFGGRPAGVFTHFLLKDLVSTSVPWSSLQSNVTADVLQFTDMHQSPELSQIYASTAVFHGLNEPGQLRRRIVQSIWQTFSEERSDPQAVKLRINPDQSYVAPGQKFNFTIRVGSQGGYLVLLEMDTDGDLNLLYPQSKKPDDALTSAGSTSFPSDPGKACTVNDMGVERVKAVLFKKKSDAEALLQTFPADGVIGSVSVARTRSIVITDNDQTPFYTSEIRFDVVPAR